MFTVFLNSVKCYVLKVTSSDNIYFLCSQPDEVRQQTRFTLCSHSVITWAVALLLAYITEKLVYELWKFSLHIYCFWRPPISSIMLQDFCGIMRFYRNHATDPINRGGGGGRLTAMWGQGRFANVTLAFELQFNDPLYPFVLHGIARIGEALLFWKHNYC